MAHKTELPIHTRSFVSGVAVLLVVQHEQIKDQSRTTSSFPRSRAGLYCLQNLNLGETPAEIHHIRTGQGAGQRADNFKVIPLCPIHHREADTA